MNQTEDFLVAKTVPSCYFLHLEATEEQPGYWLNLAHITEIMERHTGSITIKLINGCSYTFSGIHALAIIEELELIKRRYQA